MTNSLKSMIIAIDGYSSCGKSTFARLISSSLKYLYIDSGAMYRAVTLFALRHLIMADGRVDEVKLRKEIDNIKVDFRTNSVIGKDEMYLMDENVEEEIRGMIVSENVSTISKIAFVRKKMVMMQRKLGENKSVVMDGRDIGTTVFPYADIKIFMTADPLIRAERRLKELKAKGVRTTLDEVESNIRERDFIDVNRDESPLKKAEDAVVLDNSYMTIEEQMVWFKEILKERFNYSL